MATGEDLRRLALALEGTSEAPHFDRRAFKALRIFATLAPDGLTANFRFTPEEQTFRCLIGSDIFAPIQNAWGRQGWTVGRLAQLSKDDLASALTSAWKDAVARRSRRR